MNRILKIILAVFAVLILAVVAFGAIIFLDVAAYTATGSQTLNPAGTSVGNALVAYDPGLSGAAKTVADKVAADLQAANYTVTLAGIKSGAAANTAGYQIIVVGGPVYAGTNTGSVKDFCSKLSVGSSVKVGVFGSGQGAQEGNDTEVMRNALTLPSGTVVVKIGQPEDIAARTQDFVDQLLQPRLGMLP